MATRGRKPLPTKLKVLRGTDRPDRANDAEPTPEIPDSLKPPAWMKRKVAREAFAEMAARLYRLGLYTELDAMQLELLCQTYAKWREATRRSNVDPLVSPKGGSYMNPSLSAELALGKRLQAIMTEFGLSPSSRTRLTVGEKESADPLEDFLKGEHG